MAEYLQAYAEHFGLEQHIRFSTTVHTVTRDKSDRGWNVKVTGPGGESVLYFDKVVFGTGSETKPVWPAMPGKDTFSGIIIHGQNYRR